MKKERQARERSRCTDPQIGDVFLLYLSGQLSEAERQLVETHLQTCTECRAELEFFAAGRQALRPHTS